MPWYCFNFARTSQDHGNSLVRRFAKTYTSKKQTISPTEGLFTPKTDVFGHKRWYYLFVAEVKVYVDLIHQFGGKMCVPPPLTTLQHLAGDWLVPGWEKEFERKESIPPPKKTLQHKDGKARTGRG